MKSSSEPIEVRRAQDPEPPRRAWWNQPLTMAIFISSIIVAALALSSSVSGFNLKQKPINSFIKYSVIPGYFLQDNNSTNVTTFDFIETKFGLINRTYDADAQFDPQHNKSQWERFQNEVALLNFKAPSNIKYKVVWMGRHGDGIHNSAETFYTTPGWNCFWAQQPGNATVTWVDAHLTQTGINQALAVNALWKELIRTQNIQTPQSYYTSPLYRCLQTANFTFGDLVLPSEFPFVPEIKELLREGIDIHVCDSRSNASFIAQSFPTFTFEPGFTEYDLLFRNSTSETPSAQVLRSKTLLDDIFSKDDNTYISLTTHSGEGGSILSTIGHIPFSLATGAVIAFLLKVETVTGPAPTLTALPYTSQVVCNSPPITSLSNGGCVCSSGQTISTGLP